MADAKGATNVGAIAEAERTKNLKVVTGARVTKIEVDSHGRATGATFVKGGKTYFQPADVVILSTYIYENTRLLLLSTSKAFPNGLSNNSGQVGKHYISHLYGGVNGLFPGQALNRYSGPGAQRTTIDDWNGDNFDHSGLGFFGGAWISCGGSNGRPILTRPVPAGTPRWGSDWKKATAKWYNHAVNIGASGCNYAHRENYLDLDPTYKDALGRPLVRMSYNFRDNDKKMAMYIAGVLDKLATQMNPTIKGRANARTGDYNVVPYQSTHNTGGTMMGPDPQSSAVNRYCQAWGADNLFVMGASLFPQNASYNPTGLVGALAYFAAEAITTKYLKNPGPLVHA
jgi:gluconate 2-dehydrogenase alpha chain